MTWSSSSTGLKQLLRVCLSYGAQSDITFNSKKSVVMIGKTKEDQKQNFPSFFVTD